MDKIEEIEFKYRHLFNMLDLDWYGYVSFITAKNIEIDKLNNYNKTQTT